MPIHGPEHSPYACCAVHSARLVGFERGKMMGRSQCFLIACTHTTASQRRPVEAHTVTRPDGSCGYCAVLYPNVLLAEKAADSRESDEPAQIRIGSEARQAELISGRGGAHQR